MCTYSTCLIPFMSISIISSVSRRTFSSVCFFFVLLMVKYVPISLSYSLLDVRLRKTLYAFVSSEGYKTLGFTNVSS